MSKISLMPELTVVPDGAMVPVAFDGVNYRMSPTNLFAPDYAALPRNTALDAVNALANGGKLRLRKVGAVTLVDFTLKNPAFEAAGTLSVGHARLIGNDGATPVSSGNALEATAVASGDVVDYQLLTSGASVIWTRAVPGGLSITGTVTLGQLIRLTSYTSVQP
jgi:hypothetical protein